MMAGARMSLGLAPCAWSKPKPPYTAATFGAWKRSMSKPICSGAQKLM